MILIENKEYLTIHEARAILHMSRPWFQKYVDEGVIKQYRFSPKKLYYLKEDVINLFLTNIKK